MSRRSEILTRHRAAIKQAAARRNAVSISLVGSVARGTDGPDSDVDFVCEFAKGASLFDMAGLQIDLVDLLGCEVDVGSVRALKAPYDSMLADAIRL